MFYVAYNCCAFAINIGVRIIDEPYKYAHSLYYACAYVIINNAA